VKGKYPKTILTDQDPSIKEAIAMELPNTKHAFCIWHIVAKLSSWFSFPLGSRYDDFKHEFHKVYHLECADDFEREWKVMVSQFGLGVDKHIDLLFTHHKFWALAYLKDFFFCWNDNNRTLRIDKFIYKKILRCQNKFDRFCKSSKNLLDTFFLIN
jgi:hypothetical protein